MKNFLMQLFVLLPLSVLETGAGIACGALIYWLATYARDMTPSGTGTVVMVVIFLVLFLGLLVGLFFLLRWICDLDGIILQIVFALLMPIRLPLQIISVILAFIGIFAEGLGSEYEYDAEGFWANVFYLLFYCTFSLGYSSFSFGGFRRPNRDPASKRENKRKRISRFGITKSKNLLVQILVLLPIAAAQFAFFYFIFFVAMDLGDSMVPWVIGSVLALFLLSVLSTKLRGHTATGEYFDSEYQFSPGLYGDTPSQAEVNALAQREYSEGRNLSNPGDAKRTSGGWTTYIHPVTIVCLLSSPFLVFCQIVSILIAAFSDPYEGRLLSWYGEPPYRLCDNVFFQKITHFYFGYVLLSDKYV